jgi:Spy/CpxP family protein refolding chaperone
MRAQHFGSFGLARSPSAAKARRLPHFSPATARRMLGLRQAMPAQRPARRLDAPGRSPIDGGTGMFQHYCRGWPRGYAFAYATAGSSTWYETRHHGGRSRGGGFGVRRPLRYLAYQLDLTDEQTRRLAAILDRLKTEQEQVRLDEARTVSALAELVTRERVAIGELEDALKPRVQSAERMQQVVARAIQDIQELLDAEQRAEFAYLLSNHTLSL